MVKVKFDKFNKHHLCEECCDNTHSAFVVKDQLLGDLIGLCLGCYRSWKYGEFPVKIRIVQTIVE